MNNLLSTSQCTINIVQLIQLRLAIGVSLLRSVTVPGAIHTFQIRIGWWLLSGLRSTHGKQPNEHMRTTVIISSSINGSSRNTMSTPCQSVGERCTATRISLTKSGEMLEHGSLVNSGAHLQCQEDPYLYTATSTRAATRKVEDAEYGGTRTVVLRRTTVLEVQMLVGVYCMCVRPGHGT